MTTGTATEIVAGWSAPTWATNSINESGCYVDHERWTTVRNGVSACLQQTDSVEISGRAITMERGPLTVLLHIDRFTPTGECLVHCEISIDAARQVETLVGVSPEDMQMLRDDVAELLAVLDGAA
jgi:hypothetical protein